MYVKLETIYTEIDRHGNTRRFENRFEADGDPKEICFVMSELLSSNKLPGTTPLGELNYINNYLTSNTKKEELPWKT